MLVITSLLFFQLFSPYFISIATIENGQIKEAEGWRLALVCYAMAGGCRDFCYGVLLERGGRQKRQSRRYFMVE